MSRRDIALYALIAWVVIGSLAAWLFGLRPDRTREGEPCGPNHSWTNISGPGDRDLSCEPDR